MLGFIGIGSGLPGEMLGGISNEENKVLLDLKVEIRIKGSVYFIWGEIADDVGHVFEIRKTLVGGIFDVNVILVVFVELIDMWKAKRSVNIGGGNVMPQENIQVNDFFPHDGIIGILSGDFELKNYGRKLSQGTGQGVCGLGGNIFPVGCGVLGKSVHCAPVDGLKSLNLSFNGRQGYFYARFGIFSLRVEVDCLPDGNDGKYQGNKTGDDACYFHEVAPET